MQTVPVIPADNLEAYAAAGFSAGTLRKTASYTVTVQNVRDAGGRLVVYITSSSAAVDITLPDAAAVKGCYITMFKPVGSTDAHAFLATGGAKIEGGTANKRWQNATSEMGCSTIWSDGVDWRVVGSDGTWAANNS